MIFEILWTPTAQEHLQYWQKNNTNKIDKIRRLCKDIANHPTTGLGKPEHLKYLENNTLENNIWSRRIDQEHRFVYQIKNKQVFIVQARYHY